MLENVCIFQRTNERAAELISTTLSIIIWRAFPADDCTPSDD
jgi:hypothetical protein